MMVHLACGSLGVLAFGALDAGEWRLTSCVVSVGGSALGVAPSILISILVPLHATSVSILIRLSFVAEKVCVVLNTLASAKNLIEQVCFDTFVDICDRDSMMHTTSVPALRTKFEALFPVMDERVRRQWAAAEALALGYGAISAVAVATGLARNTIAVGIGELRQRRHDHEPTPTIRRPGAGRKRLATSDPELLQLLDALVDPTSRGDPDCPLRWTCKSTRKLADELTRQGQPVSDRSVALLLHEAGYSLQANRKTREGSRHPDRNAQFEYINDQVRSCQQRGQPVISVDTNKKELVGDFKNGGQQ